MNASDPSRRAVTTTHHPPPTTHARSALFLGGVRSGKSRMAQAWVAARGPRRTYLATCPRDPTDSEMAARIARHVADRAGQGWETVEETLDPAAVIARTATPVLLDCATLWLTNLGCQLDWDEAAILDRVDGLCAMLATPSVAVAVVSNEVGMGVVPEHPLGRAFRDLQGFANQRLAAACGEVTFCISGLPLVLKSGSSCTP
jgi:adenosylcobinamide kinase/adenosylcobinamide-phosphate guanylyltransferase